MLDAKLLVVIYGSIVDDLWPSELHGNKFDKLGLERLSLELVVYNVMR